jgi:hypothetical protein
MAQRLAANNIANAQLSTNADAAMLRANEQAQAESQLGQILGGARAQDVGLSQFNAGQLNQGAITQGGYDQSTLLANLDADLRNRAQVDDATQKYLSMGMSREEADQRAKEDLEKLKGDQFLGAQGITEQSKGRIGGARSAVVGGAIGAAGSVLGHLV